MGTLILQKIISSAPGTWMGCRPEPASPAKYAAPVSNSRLAPGIAPCGIVRRNTSHLRGLPRPSRALPGTPRRTALRLRLKSDFPEGNYIVSLPIIGQMGRMGHMGRMGRWFAVALSQASHFPNPPICPKGPNRLIVPIHPTDARQGLIRPAITRRPWQFGDDDLRVRDMDFEEELQGQEVQDVTGSDITQKEIHQFLAE